ncbi:MAG: 50S ribosomal protein L11 methyltransferase [Alphaproteobacteria bacterium]|nr:50S ribosomal protein L11 methyltransferase [Alphaproteobacteria bacterium]
MRLVRPRDLLVTLEPDGAVMIRSTSRGAGARAPAWAVQILAFCSEPRTRAECEQAMGPTGAQAFDGLADAGLLVPAEEQADSPVIFANYAGVDIHRYMLNDEVRLQAYWEGLKAVVKPDDVVIDAGSGTGVLATMAALAGAKRVYAIERTDFAQVIPQVAADSGVGDIVQVVRADLGQVELPEKATVMVTETFGHVAFAEGMMEDVLACVQRNMVADPRIVPFAFSLHAAPLATAPKDLLHPFRKRPEGVDLTSLLGDARGRAHDRKVLPAEVGPTIDLGTVAMPCRTEWETSFELPEACGALAMWFTLHMAPGADGRAPVDMPSGPHDPTTHWEQTLLPVALSAGEHHLRIHRAPEDGRTIVIDIDGHEVRSR